MTPLSRHGDMEGFRNSANAFFIAKGPGKARSAQRLRWREAVHDQMSQIPLEEPGYLLQVDRKYPPPEPGEQRYEPMRRTIRVPKDISFHQLHAIVAIAMQKSPSVFYQFFLWELPPRHAGIAKQAPGYADEAKELLVEDPSEEIVIELETEEGYVMKPTWKSSKNRKLSQVFGGSRLWKEVPYKIQYELRRHDYNIECLGETDVTLDGRPGQEVFCFTSLTVEGQLVLDDLPCMDDACYDQNLVVTWDKNQVNRDLSQWCFEHRRQRTTMMG